LANGENILLAREAKDEDRKLLPQLEEIKRLQGFEVRTFARQLHVTVCARLERGTGVGCKEGDQHERPNNDKERAECGVAEPVQIPEASEGTGNRKASRDDMPTLQPLKAKEVQRNRRKVTYDDDVRCANAKALYHHSTIDKPRPAWGNAIGNCIEVARCQTYLPCGAMEEMAAKS